MIQNCTYSSGLDYIELMWKSPVYKPQTYEVYYSCSLWGGEEHYYVSRKVECQNSTSTSVIVSALLPESTCLLTLYAVYNPASLDQGITIMAETLRAAKPICKFS